MAAAIIPQPLHTAGSSAELRDRCLAAGMNGWLEKPTPSTSEPLRQLLAACTPLGIGS